MTKNKLLVWLGLPALILALAIAVAAIHSRAYSASLTIEVAPQQATITLNGKPVKQGGIRVKPGPQHVAASMAGFASAAKDIQAAKGQKNYVGLVLLPNSAATADWYKNHPSDQRIAEGISSKNFDIGSNQSVAQRPLILKLPYIAAGFEFKIDYGKSRSSTSDLPAIYITAPNETAKQDALNWIIRQGYDPTKLEIVYINGNPATGQ